MLRKSFSKLLTETKDKAVVFVFGRFNPVTSGHEKLINKAKEVASRLGADLRIYTSQSQDEKKNPLTYDQKMKYLKLSFSSISSSIINDTSKRTPFEVFGDLAEKYKDITMIAGSDRISEFESGFKNFNKNYNLGVNKISVVNAGDRDPDAEDVSGMSASKMRSLAASGDFRAFKSGCPSNLSEPFAKQMFNDVRRGMRLVALKEQLYMLELYMLDPEGLGIPREKLQWEKKILDFFKDAGLQHEYVDVFTLKPTQDHIEKAKVMSLIGKDVDVPIVISKDNYVIDGHHRWMAKRYDPSANYKINAIRINLPVEDIISRVDY